MLLTLRRLCALLMLAMWGMAHAGVMDAAAMRKAFASPFIVGEKDTALPVWPLFKQDGTETPLVGYAFESIDLAPLPGFSGTPMNLLVLLDAKGSFREVRVLSQHEPVFVDGLGEGPLLRFVAQYPGLSLKQRIKIGSNTNRAEQAGSSLVYIDGVAKATASVRILNQSLVSAALQVARAKLGFAPGRDPSMLAHVVQPAPTQSLDWEGLRKAGLVQSQRWVQADIDKAFKNSGADRPEAEAQTPANALFSELHVAYLNLPDVGRNLLTPKGWDHLMGRLEPGDHALLVVSRGPYSFVGENFVRGAVPDRIALHQGELPIEVRDLDLDEPIKLPPDWHDAQAKVLRVIGASGLDPAQAMSLSLRVMRNKGMVFAERIGRDFGLDYTLPSHYVSVPQNEQQNWRSSWASRAWELAVLGVGLALLTLMLWRPAWLVRHEPRLRWTRNAYLVFTLVFIGWVAQGQLSIVNLTAAIQALVAGRGLGFMLYDPMTVTLWAYVAMTLFVWGRGTFCGWLCPFGALQDLISQATQWAGLHRLHVHRDWDKRLKRLKYGVLALVVCLAAVPGSAMVDTAIEVEPFKTAITLGFARSWPHVVWAVGMLVLSSVVYKGYCRYLCPLGAAVAILGQLRLQRWIPRRAECGTPCQTCRHRCHYQAIAPQGQVDYTECFQCMDCVAIHNSDTRCAPLIGARKHKVIAIQSISPH